MISILPNDIPTQKLHAYLLGAVGPRPIAFASTIDEKGRPNLSPLKANTLYAVMAEPTVNKVVTIIRVICCRSFIKVMNDIARKSLCN